MTAEDVKKLREMTGAGVMEVKRALEEASGDFEKAIAIINERGFAKADKKAERATGAGGFTSYIHSERIAVLLELRSETDFVARLEDFKNLGKEIALQIVATDPSSVEELLSQPYIKDSNMTVEALVKGIIAKTGENIQIGRFCRYAL